MNQKPIYYNEVRDWLKERVKEEGSKRNYRLIYEQSILKEALELKSPCVRCGRTDKQSLDHVVPRDILKSFGIDPDSYIIEGNYQILCLGCNHLKSNRLDFGNPKTKEILIKLLETL